MMKIIPTKKVFLRSCIRRYISRVLDRKNLRHYRAGIALQRK